MKTKITFVMGLFIAFLLISGCGRENTPIEKRITLEGEFIKNFDPPYSGPIINTHSGFYFLNEDKLNDIIGLEDGTKIKVVGTLSEQKTNIPEAGKFRTTIVTVINVESFEVLE